MSGPDYHRLSYREQVGRARRLAEVVHASQTDKQGRPYIWHPAMVYAYYMRHRRDQFYDAMMEFGTAAEPYYGQMACWLHDTIEDTPLRLKNLLDFGFPERAVSVVASVTFLKDTETRRLYYSRIRRDPTALAVKAADLDHNTEPVRLEEVGKMHGESERRRLEDKYAVAYQTLGIKPLEGRPELRRLEKR